MLVFPERLNTAKLTEARKTRVFRVRRVQQRRSTTKTLERGETPPSEAPKSAGAKQAVRLLMNNSERLDHVHPDRTRIGEDVAGRAIGLWRPFEDAAHVADVVG